MDPDRELTLPPELTTGDVGTDLLATYWPAGIALGLAALAVAVWIYRARRDPDHASRRVRRAFLWWVPASIALVLGLALGVNTWVGYLPSVAAVQRWIAATPEGPVVLPSAGSTERHTDAGHGYAFMDSVPSSTPSVPASAAWVYLPPDYDKPGNTTRYPVIYALHGSPGSSPDWFSGGRIDGSLDILIRDGLFPPAIVVAPDLNAGAGRSGQEPLNQPGGPQMEDFVVNDVVGWADKNLRTLPESGQRVIAGMSSGAMGALNYGLGHPEIFAGTIALIGYATPYSDAIKNNPEALAATTPENLLDRLPAGTGPRIFLGQNDGKSLPEMQKLAAKFREHGLTSTLREFKGLQHNWTAARTMMPYGLVWMAQELGWTPPR